MIEQQVDFITASPSSFSSYSLCSFLYSLLLFFFCFLLRPQTSMYSKLFLFCLLRKVITLVLGPSSRPNRKKSTRFSLKWTDGRTKRKRHDSIRVMFFFFVLYYIDSKIWDCCRSQSTKPCQLVGDWQKSPLNENDSILVQVFFLLYIFFSFVEKRFNFVRGREECLWWSAWITREYIYSPAILQRPRL